jgi:hypothetical protein
MAAKLQRLAIADYRQFRDIVYDFTHRETGKPLQRVCLIGGNGTGKSTVLRVLWKALGSEAKGPKMLAEFVDGAATWQRFFGGWNRPGSNYIEPDFAALWDRLRSSAPVVVQTLGK